MTFGEYLRTLRRAARLSQEELAERAGMTANGISALERGQRTRPYPHTVRALADALNLTAGEREAFAAAAKSRATEGRVGAASQPRSTANSAPTAAFPRPLESLIGRDIELAQLEKLLRSHRIVTLTGPAGAGKTRLAAELANRAQRPVWWVDLSMVIRADGLLAALAGATGAAAGSELDPAILSMMLADQQGLVVLDTCEQVRRPVRELAELILRNCPELSLLLTSRQPIGAATELTWPVAPLSIPDLEEVDPERIVDSSAVQLFVQRAGRRRPGFALTEQNRIDVARICALLDGLPLALELAAGHAGAMEPAVMLRVLDDRLRLLVDEARDDRQHTLRSAIAWSYDLLPSDEALFFARLSAFVGPFSLEAAAAVAGAGLQHDGLELLLSLARQSLVAVNGDGRYRLLDTVRAFASEQLANRGPEKVDTQRRHATWYVDLLNEAGLEGRHGAQGWRGEVRDALPDLRYALEWCFSAGEPELGARLLAEMWWFWPREGALEEASHWFQQAKTVVADAELEADLLASRGAYAVSRGDLTIAAEDCELAAALYEPLDHQLGLARCLIVLGIAHWGQGNYAEAAQAHDRAVDLFSTLDDPWGLGLALVLRARTAIDAEEDAVGDLLDTAEAAALASGDEHVTGAVLVQRARWDIAQHRYDEAADSAGASLRLNEEHGHREGALGARHALAMALIGQHQTAAAHEVSVRALKIALSMHHRGAVAESLDCLAAVAAEQQEWSQSARILAAANTQRSRSRIRRSPLVSQIAARVEQAVAAQMSPTELTRAQREGQAIAIHLLAAAEEARLRDDEPPPPVTRLFR